MTKNSSPDDPVAALDRPRVYLSAPHMSGREQELVAETFASNFIAPVGPMLSRFESALVQTTGFEHVAAVTSGTAALHLALRLCGVGPEDDVWSSTLTFIGGVGPILYQNARPVFFDVNRFGLIDLDLVEEELGRANARNMLPKVLILTDLYGIPCDVGRARALCDRFGITVICDCAESLGSTLGGVSAGVGAKFAIYSFNGNKIITTSGGGALASPDKHAIGEAVKLATQAREAVLHYEHESVGYNYRLSNVCAAIGVGQLEVLDARVSRKREIFDLYRRGLSDLPDVSVLDEPEGARSNRWLSVVFLDEKKYEGGPHRVIAALEAKNIESRPLWKPMHLQPVFADAVVHGGEMAAKMFHTGVCLPSGTAMGDDTVSSVISIIRETLI